MLTDYQDRARRRRPPCRHPRRAVEYQSGGVGAPARLRCRDCGQQLLELERPRPRPRDKRKRLP
jgi:hypothetical protein